jgi:hypothetical protein
MLLKANFARLLLLAKQNYGAMYDCIEISLVNIVANHHFRDQILGF